MQHITATATLWSLITASATALAQSPIVYNAARGTLPSAQCFQVLGDPSLMSLSAGELRIETGPNSDQSYFQRNDFVIDFDAGFEASAAIRIARSTELTLPGGQIRYGVQMQAVDEDGSVFVAMFSENTVAILTSPNDPVTTANTTTAPVPLVDRSVAVRMTADSTTLRVFIDGVIVASHPKGPDFPAFGRQFYFGDGTLSGSADVHISQLRASGNTPSCTPTSVAHVASGCTGLGTLAVSGLLQPGQSSTQTFTVPGTASDGIPLIFLGPYAMQTPYCSGCRFGFDPMTALVSLGENLSVTFPAAVTGLPYAFQGVRILGSPGPCSTPLVHQVTDVCVVTL
ncbi:MAG: hypothetical protein ACE37K_15635 [Planctomycetota bacterium]